MQAQLERAPERRPIRGVQPVEGKEYTTQKVVTLIMTLAPFAAFLWAVTSLWGRGLSGVDAGIALTAYLITGLGITVGFHRLFAHKAFRAPAPVRTALAVAGSLAIEGSVLSWTATHRRHHAFSDRPGDPHSPHVEAEDGPRGMLRGLWHAHTGWLFDAEKTLKEDWAPDLVKDRAVARVDERFGTIALVSFLLPAVAGFALTGRIGGAVTAFIWGSLVRVFMLHHVTWSINSICHYFGTRPYEVKDESKNNALIAPISFGEGWHNNHHAFPSSARIGLRWYQIDLGWYLIGTLKQLRLVRDVRVPTKDQRQAKRR